jgi:hypothetical protein
MLAMRETSIAILFEAGTTKYPVTAEDSLTLSAAEVYSTSDTALRGTVSVVPVVTVAGEVTGEAVWS